MKASLRVTIWTVFQ